MMVELLEGLTSEEYHAHPALSQSAIKEYLRDPQLYFQTYVARTIPRRPTTASQQFGKDVEEVAFTGRLNAVTIPESVMQERRSSSGDGSVTYAKAGAPYNAWVREQQLIHGEGVRLLKAEEFNKKMGPAAVMQAVESLRAHSFANTLLWGTETVRHVRVCWIDDLTGMQCRCEIDIVSLLNVISDLKTSVDVTSYGFARSVCKFGYDIQAWFYRQALHKLAEARHALPDTELVRSLMPLLNRIADGEETLYCWVAVKNSPSYHAEVHPCDAEWFTIAEPIVRQAMFAIKESTETGDWQTKTFGKITNMKPPKFAFSRIEELAETEDD